MCVWYFSKVYIPCLNQIRLYNCYNYVFVQLILNLLAYFRNNLEKFLYLGSCDLCSRIVGYPVNDSADYFGDGSCLCAYRILHRKGYPGAVYCINNFVVFKNFFTIHKSRNYFMRKLSPFKRRPTTFIKYIFGRNGPASVWVD